MQLEVKVRKIIDNNKPHKAVFSVTMGGMFDVHNVRVIKTDKGCFVGMIF